MKSTIVFIIASAISLLLWFVVQIVLHVQFTQNCGGYLHRAANANTIELATAEMQKVVDYLDRNDLKSGYTSVLWRTPGDDIGFWYKNLSSSLMELKQLDKNASQLEKSNVLLKLRETLTDHEGLIAPTGIDRHPHNGILALWACLSLTFIISGIVIAIKIDSGY